MASKKHGNQPKKNSRKKRKAAIAKQNNKIQNNAKQTAVKSKITEPSVQKDSEAKTELTEQKTSDTKATDNSPKPKKKEWHKLPFHTTIYFIGLVLYLELLFHGYHFGLGNIHTLRVILFAGLIGGLLSLVTSVFPKIINHILTIALTVLLCIIFIVQFLHYSVFKHFLAFFGMLQYTNQAADNFDTVWLNMKSHALMMFLFLLPIILVSVFAHRLLNLNKRNWKQSLIIFGSILITYVGSIFGMKFLAGDTYSAFEMYRYYTSVDMAVEKLGVCETFLVDTRQGIAGKLGFEDDLQFHMASNSSSATSHTKEPEADKNVSASDTDTASTEESTEEIIDTSPNVIDIDFNKIAEESGNASVASLCEYFNTLEPTKKNEYTGMFEGFNVIEITAEGFSGYALDSNLFPTLSMMANEGFVFENYYSPLWYGSTLGGEYANLMGSMPKNGGYLSLSHGAANGNNFLFALGNQMKAIGYDTYAFHNNSSTYYDRNITHPHLGYTWIANGTGLEPQVNEWGTTLWPQSDLVMIQDTFDKYTTKQPFHLYYMTVSGHVVYSFGGNAMSQKNQDIVANLPYTETTRAYLAAQYELELAMAELIQELKDNGLYENTVIILTGDHVPYDNMEILDELAGHELEDNFEAYKSTLMIWSGAIEAPIKVRKPCSSIDILPTVSNLLGLEYDSRLIIGQDILSDSPGLVMFANRSFITDDFSYNASNGTITSFDGSEISDEQLSEMRAFVANKFTAADAITEYDFYKYVAPYKTYTVDKLTQENRNDTNDSNAEPN